MSVDNNDINGDYCYMNGYTGYESNNHNYIDYTKKRYEIYTIRYVMENNGLLASIRIYIMVTASTLNQYVNME